MQEQAVTTNGEKLLTKADVANQAQNSMRTVSYWIATRQLAYVKLGRAVRILQSDFDAFIKSHRIGGRK
jgi:excisionase family DNA binding protein